MNLTHVDIKFIFPYNIRILNGIIPYDVVDIIAQRTFGT